MKMSRQIPWMRVSAEGAIIVVSILLAFAIDAWGAEREADRKARRELGVVLEELREGRLEIEAMGRWHHRLGEGVKALAAELSRQPDGGLVMVPDTLLAGAVLFPITDPPLAVLDAFLGSGHLERLGNERLRRNLASWRAQVHDMIGDELRGRTFEDSELMPYLRAEFDMVSAQEAGMSIWLAGLDQADGTEVGEIRLRSDRRLRNLIARQIAVFRLTNSQSEAVLSSLDSLIILIEDELGLPGSPAAVVQGGH